MTVLAPGHGEGTIDRVIAEPLSHRDARQGAHVPARPGRYTLKVHAVEERIGKADPERPCRADL